MDGWDVWVISWLDPDLWIPPFLDFLLCIKLANLIQGALFKLLWFAYFSCFRCMPLCFAQFLLPHQLWHGFPCKACVDTSTFCYLWSAPDFLSGNTIRTNCLKLWFSCLTMWLCLAASCWRVLFNKVKKTISNLKIRLLVIKVFDHF